MTSIRKRKRSRQAGRKKKLPRTSEQFFSQPTLQQERLMRVAHALTAMRSEGTSLKQAARAFHLDPRTILAYGGSGIRKNDSGRYVPKASDRVPRVMAIPTARGVAEIAIKNSRDATRLGKYWNAVQHFLDTGDESELRAFRGASLVDASGQHISLITDPDQLEHLGYAGVLSFESIYARTA